MYCLTTYTGDKSRNDILFLGLCGFAGGCQCFPGYVSTPVLNRCVPAPGSQAVVNSTETKNVMQRIRDSDVSRQVLADVNNGKYLILACAGIAFALSWIWLLLIRCCAGFMVWTTIVFVVILSIVLSVFLCLQAKRARDKYNDAKRKSIETIEQNLQQKTLTAFAVLVTVFTFVLIIVLIAMRRRIQLAIAILKEAGRVLADEPTLFFVPLCIFVLIAGFLAYWIATSLYLATTGTPLYDPETGVFVRYQVERQVRYMQLYHLFGLLWWIALLLGANEMIIAGGVATWYFSLDNKLQGWPILRTVRRTLLYHLGSLALGSLLIAIVQFIRMMIEYIQTHLKKYNNDFVKFLMKCLAYLFFCLERFLKFITRNAYIQIAIYGESFCTAARQVWAILMRNALRLIAVDFIGDFLINLGKIVVMFGTALAGLFLLKRDEKIVYWAIPWLLILIVSFAIATAFFGLYEMAIDTIFLCFCEDCERNDGSASRPYYMSEELQAFTDKHKREETDLGAENAAAGKPQE